MKILFTIICFFLVSCSSYKILEEKAKIDKVTFNESHNEWQYVDRMYMPQKVEDCYQLIIKTTKGIDSICISPDTYLKIYKGEDSLFVIFKWYDGSNEIQLQKIMPLQFR